MNTKRQHIIIALVFICSMVSSYSQARKDETAPDSLSHDSIKQIVYTGLSKNVVDYLEANPNAKHLSQFLTKYYGIEIDSNQAILLNIAASNYGLQDIIGDSSNADVIRFFTETNHPEIIDDETSWCSIYMCWCAQIARLESSSSLLARSWLDVGTVVEKPKTGDIVIFWREKQRSWQGHVSIFINEDPETHQVYCLGGNQDDKVCVKSYPAEQVLGYRRLNVIAE